MHPAYIYAFEQLGYLVTELNMDTFSDEEIEAWEAAVDEWIVAHPEDEQPNGAGGRCA